MEADVRNRRTRRVVRIAYFALFPVLLLLIFAMTGLHRFAGTLLIAAAFILYLSSFWNNTTRAALIVCAVAAASLLSPIDICSPYDRGLSYTAGKIGVLPLVLGIPTTKTLESAHRGEVVVGGCIVAGMDPKYVIAW